MCARNEKVRLKIRKSRSMRIFGTSIKGEGWWKEDDETRGRRDNFWQVWEKGRGGVVRQGYQPIEIVLSFWFLMHPYAPCPERKFWERGEGNFVVGGGVISKKKIIVGLGMAVEVYGFDESTPGPLSWIRHRWWLMVFCFCHGAGSSEDIRSGRGCWAIEDFLY